VCPYRYLKTLGPLQSGSTNFDAALPIGDSFGCWMPLPRPAVQAPIGLYSKTWQKLVAGNWRMIHFIPG